MGVSEFTEITIAKAARFCLVFLCGIMSFTLLLIYLIDGKFANDFTVYWRTANHHEMWAYSTMAEWPFPYAPTMLLWIKPLALVPLWPAFFLWVAISIASLAWACRPYLSSKQTLLVLTSPPIVHGLFTGQVSGVLAAVIIWACATSNRVAAGIAFGIIASIKPQLVIMAPLLFLLTHDWRAIAASAMTFLATVVASVLIFGPERWSEWIASMGYFHWILTTFKIITACVSPAAAADRFGLPPVPFLILGGVVGAFVVYQCRNRRPMEKAAALAAGSLMASPYALTYDLAPVVPFLVWSVFQGRIWPVIALMGQLNPLPLTIAVIEMLRRTPLPRLGWNPSLVTETSAEKPA